jgi:hypothetical protein
MPKIYLLGIACGIFVLACNNYSKKGISFSHFSDKLRPVQIVNYKPEKARDGRNGDARIFVIKIFRGANRGKDGKNGSTPAPVRLYVSAFASADSTMLRIIASLPAKKSRTDTFFVNPRYGEIKFIADGGDGGDGGAGQTGLSKSGKKSATSGGSGGNGGKGGAGGKIEVFMDSSAMAYAGCKCLIFSNDGGYGGVGGAGGSAAADYDLGGYSGKGSDGASGEMGVKGPPVYIMDAVGKKILFVKQ